LPVPYYHVVFTLPARIADIAYQNKDVIYDLLFNDITSKSSCCTTPLWIARNRANIDAARPGCPAWARSSNKEGMYTFALKGVGLGCVATAEAVSFAPPRSHSPVAGRVRDRQTHTSRRTKRTWSNDIPHAQQHIANHQAEEEGQQQLH
jgi:hypothetical protein